MNNKTKTVFGLVTIILLTYLPSSFASAIGSVGTTSGGPPAAGGQATGVKGYAPSGREGQKLPADGIQAPKDGDLYVPRSDVSGSSSSAPNKPKTTTTANDGSGTPYRGNFIQQTPTDFSRGNTTSPGSAPGGVSEGTPYRGNYPRTPE